MTGIKQFVKILFVTELCLTIVQLVFLSTEHSSIGDTDANTKSSAMVPWPGGDPTRRTIVAIGMAITTKHMKSFRWTDVEHSSMAFLNSFLVSFCRTASPGFRYRIYLAYDDVDDLFASEEFRRRLSRTFHDYVHGPLSGCPVTSSYSLHYVLCRYTAKPVWSQNDAMIAAYVDGADYFYRVNDDTTLATAGWTEAFIEVLGRYDPPNVGVVGPRHSGGNEYILTYDFVHRTHIEIFGFYYPRFYETWYADDWITELYQPGRTTKLLSVFVQHTQSLGTRYDVSQMMPESILNAHLNDIKETLFRYINAKQRPPLPPDPRNVISMVIWNNNPASLWGSIRNAQLRYLLYPNWTLRVYVYSERTIAPRNNDSSNKTTIFDTVAVVNKLKELQVDVVFLNESSLLPYMPPSAANLLTLADPEVAFVLFRKPELRLSDREAAAVGDWLEGSQRGRSAHCIRDHRRHSRMAIVPGLLAVNLTAIRNKYRKGLLPFLSGYFAKQQTMANMTDSKKEQDIYDYLWHLLGDIVCHDSVSCRKWQNSVAFTRRGSKRQFVGQHYSLFHPTNQDQYVMHPPDAACVPKA